MRVPAAAQLLPKYARASIGYRVLTTGRATFSDYTRAGVVEERPAFYVVRGGAEVPDGGGFICWGTGIGNTIIEEGIAPAAPDHTGPIRADIAERFDYLGEMFAAQLRQLESSVVAEAKQALEAIAELGKVRNELNQTKTELNEALRASVSEISQNLERSTTDLAERLTPQDERLHLLSESAARIEESQQKWLVVENRLNSILRTVGQFGFALGSTETVVAQLGQQVAQLREAADASDSAARQRTDTLRILGEAVAIMGGEVDAGSTAERIMRIDESAITDQRQADTLRILNEATRLLS